MKNIRFFSLSFLVIILDQISKIIVRNHIELGRIIRVTEKLFWLTHVENTGSAFSFTLVPNNPDINRYALVFIAFIASVIIAVLMAKSKLKIEKIVFALILGGAVGNLIDRIIFGRVTDFLWLDFPDIIMNRWPVFNIADSSIVIAVTIMAVYILFFSKKTEEDK